MCWGIVEVRPEPNHCLFVRFKDGLAGRVVVRTTTAGRVHLPPEKLTGAPGPLRVPRFFEQASLDNAAVSWSSGVDLYAEVAGKDEHSS